LINRTVLITHLSLEYEDRRLQKYCNKEDSQGGNKDAYGLNEFNELYRIELPVQRGYTSVQCSSLVLLALTLRTVVRLCV